MVAAGKCRLCGAKRKRYAFLCDFHGKKAARYMRRYRAHKRADKSFVPPDHLAEE